MNVRIWRMVAISGVIAMQALHGISDRYAQTFFRPRAIINQGGMLFNVSNFQQYHDKRKDPPYSRPRDRSKIKFQSTYFYQESQRADDLARYFFLGGLHEQSVIELDSGDTVPNNNVDSGWFRVVGDLVGFRSTLTMQPERTAYGAVFTYNQDISEIINGLWLQVVVPLSRVRHRQNFVERNIQNSDAGNDVYANMTDALQAKAVLSTGLDAQYPLRYGKVNLSSMDKKGLSDMEIKLGWNIFRKEKSQEHLGIYGNLVIPMGDEPTAEYIFEPVLGSQHWAVGAGFNFDKKFWHLRKANFRIVADGKFRYAFDDTEKRSMDLKNNGPWSRYLLTLQEGEDFSSATSAVLEPVINFSTRDLSVRPGAMLDGSIAVHIRASSVNFEAGYNFWWRDRESVKDENAFDKSVGIFDLEGLTNNSASTATIANSETVADSSFTKITKDDFDIESATLKSAASHTVFVGASITGKLFKFPTMLGLGGSYEFQSANTSLAGWAGWVKTSMSF